jgi:hypothetical protein
VAPPLDDDDDFAPAGDRPTIEQPEVRVRRAPSPKAKRAAELGALRRLAETDRNWLGAWATLAAVLPAPGEHPGDPDVRIPRWVADYLRATSLRLIGLAEGRDWRELPKPGDAPDKQRRALARFQERDVPAREARTLVAAALRLGDEGPPRGAFDHLRRLLTDEKTAALLAIGSAMDGKQAASIAGMTKREGVGEGAIRARVRRRRARVNDLA